MKIPLGSAWMIAVGYFDPGNWATDLEAGSAFGYELLWVMLVANIMAIFLQHLCLRLAVYCRRDLAQVSRLAGGVKGRRGSPLLWKLLNVLLYGAIEAAMVATDLAQLMGSALALRMLFGMPLPLGCLVSALDVFLVFFLFSPSPGEASSHGPAGRSKHADRGELCNRLLEWFVAVLMLFVTICVAAELVWLRQRIHWGRLLSGLLVPRLKSREQLLATMGLIGATVMPHNLYLHSALAREEYCNEEGDQDNARIQRGFVRKKTCDTTIALMAAVLVNGGILVMAAAVTTIDAAPLSGLESVARLLQKTIGRAAGILYALGLLASGISATIAGTLSGQAVIEGFFCSRSGADDTPLLNAAAAGDGKRLFFKKWRTMLMRAVTLGLAMVLASTMAHLADDVLFYSQVALSLQLPLAIFPLVWTAQHSLSLPGRVVAWLIAATTLLMNGVFCVLSVLQRSS